MIALASLQRIDLAELQACADLATRLDRKYVVHAPALQALFERLAGSHRVLEIAGRRTFAYRTTYYDTDDLVCLRDHTQQRRRRFKLRKRRYVDTRRAVVEVKLTGFRGATIKEARTSSFADDLLDDERKFLSGSVLAAFGRQLRAEQLAPRLDVVCRRVTLVAPALGERLTCDVALELGGRRLRAGVAIVESKSAYGNALADRVLRTLGQHPVASCSKYCLGMSFADPTVRANSLRPLHRHFEPPTSGARAR